MAGNSNNSSIIQKIFSNYLFRVMAAWFAVYIKDKITGPAQEVLQAAQNMLNTVIAYLRTAPQDIFLTQAEYDALPDTEEEMQPGDLYYKMDPTKAFNIEEEQAGLEPEQASHSDDEGGAA